jgi:hypothetical protein
VPSLLFTPKRALNTISSAVHEFRYVPGAACSDMRSRRLLHPERRGATKHAN